MKINRRSFIGLGTLAACATTLNARLFAVPTPNALPCPPALCANGEAVLAYVRSYSARFRVVDAPGSGGVRSDGPRELYLLAEVADVERWPAAMGRLPFAGARVRVRASGNALTLAVGGLNVTIENLTPEVFARRLTRLA